MDRDKFFDKCLSAIMIGVFSLGISILEKSLNKLNTSVNSLNEKMAVVVQTVAMHDRQISDIPQILVQLAELKARLDGVERKCEAYSR